MALVFLPVFSQAGTQDDVAVVIGNRNYRNARVPAVEYAQRDADAFDRYLTEILGYKDGNVIDLRDATQAEMEAVLGNGRTVQGRLWQLVKPGQSNVTVYFSGHGAPGQQDHKGYLLPADADPEKPEINGFPIDLLIDNLGKLTARSVAVYLDACFSGQTPKGSLMHSASGIFITPKGPTVQPGVTVLTAGQSDQVASWDSHSHHGLFTVDLLDGLYGKADQPPYGNGDGKVTVREVKAYLDDVMTYAARREFGRTQVASLYGDEDRVLSVLPGGKPIARHEPQERQQEVAAAQVIQPPPPAPTAAPVEQRVVVKTIPSHDLDALFWASIKDSRKLSDFEAYLHRFPNGTFTELAKSRLEDLKTPAPASTPAAAEIVIRPPAQPAVAPLWQTAAPSVAHPQPSRPSKLLYTSEDEARESCPRDIVVWVNTDTNVYHYPGRRWYGRTKDGAYMCEGSKNVVGARPATNRQ